MKKDKHYFRQKLKEAETTVYSDPKGTLIQLNEIIENYSELEDENQVFKAYNLIFWAHYVELDIPGAKRAVDTMSKKFKISTDPERFGIHNLQKGLIAYEEEKHAEAIQYYSNILQMVGKIKNKKIISAAYSNLGSLYNVIGSNEKAIEYFIKSISFKEVKSSQMEIARGYLNIGICYNRLKNEKKAIQFLKKALREIKGAPEEIRISAYALNSLGNIYTDLEEYEKAEYNFKKGLKYTEQESDPKIRVELLTGMGRLYFYLGKVKQGNEFISEGILLSQKLKIKDAERDCYQFLSEWNFKQNNFKEAYENLKKYATLKDEIANALYLEKLAEKEKSIEELTTQLNVKDLEEKNVELQHELEQKQKELTTYLLKAININNELKSLKGESHSSSRRNESIDAGSTINWKEFEMRFNDVYNEFFNNLQEKHPKLSNTEIILAALLKLRLRSKDIASLMNVLPSTIEIYRYRLRKKCNLNSQDNLIAFINTI